MTIETARLLAAVPIFAGLAEDELSTLAGLSVQRHYRARETLFWRGDSAQHLYILASGCAKATAIDAEGRETLFAVMSAGDVFGELALLDGGERSATVTAVEACDVVMLEREALLASLSQRPDVAIRLLQTVAARVRRLSGLLEDVVFRGLPTRLARALTELSRTFGRPLADGTVAVELRLSQRELGAMVNATRESINKQLRVWTDEGLLSHSPGRIIVRNPDELQRLATGTL